MSSDTQLVSSRVQWTPKALKRLQPRERVLAKLPKSESLWKKATAKWEPKRWRKGLGLCTPTVRRAVEQACDGIASEDLSDCQPSIVFALLEAPTALLQYWVAKGEGDRALEAAVGASYLGEQSMGVRFLHRTKPTPFVGEEFVTVKHWTLLRKLMLGCPDETYEKARDWAQTTRPSLEIARRCTLSYVFPGEPEWALEDAQELVQNPPSAGWGTWVPEFGWLVLHSLTDVGLMTQLVQTFDYSPNWTPWPILESAQERYLDVMRSRLDRASELAAEQLAPLFEALTLVGTLEVAEYLVPLLKKKLPKAAKTSVSEYFGRFPELALRVLPGAGKEADAIVSTLVRSDPERAELVLQGLSGSQRKSLAGLVERLSPSHPVASKDQWPKLLQNPPWQAKKAPKKGTVVKGVENLSFSSRIDWRGRPKPRTYFYDRPPQKSTPERVKKGLQELRGRKSHNIFEIDRVPDEAALTFLEEAPHKVWSIYQDHLLPLPARFGVKAVEPLLKLAKKKVGLAAEALSFVVSPQVAPFMAEALEKKTPAKYAKLWFEHYPEAAAIGLIPVAVGPHGKQRAAAEVALRRLPPELVREVSTRYGDQVKRAVEELLDFDPLSLYPKKLPKLPPFAEPANLPSVLTTEKKALPSEAVTEILTMLAFSSLESPYAGLAVLAQELNSESLESFSWELFENWLRAGADAKQQWAFESLAHFGADEAARLLTPLVRKWPGESAHQRAVLGLDILGAIGTDVALMNLHGIAQKLRFKALQAKAREKIEQIAKARNLSREELADRLVPDLGLGPSGTLTLDYGPRQFEVRLDEQLIPYALDQGRRLKNLPKPGKKDDGELAAASLKRWKALKKDCKQVAKGQVLRLLRGMTFRRRWTPPDFERFMVSQPLVYELTRRLVWGVYQDSQLVTTFRVCEDRTLAEQNDQPYLLGSGCEIGIPHPLELSKQSIEDWQEVLADYELLQPFDQLARPAVALSSEEMSSKAITRFQDKTVAFSRVLALEDRGWQRGEVYDSGVVVHFEKIFEENRAIVSIEPGLFLGSIRDSGDQTLGEVTLISHKGQKEYKFEELDPILISELLLDLEAL